MSLKLKIVIITLSLLLLIPLVLLGYVYHTVTREAENRIQRGVIDGIIASESPVYYDDGVTPIGVFFDKTHRKYIHYNQIPKVFVNALIAAEDSDFFNHNGFDFKAIVRAVVANLRAGKVVQGGSTITQQTAKNVFRRERRSLKAKIKELVQAFLLERRYSKEEILEMYVNQFFVTGYGKGLRIASQYFFDKDAEDLDLVEAAFIAGCVKAPNRYNPFIRRTAREKEEALALAKARKDYVLKRMLDLGMITPEQFAAAREREVPFKQGKITYRLNVVLDYIREQLESEYFRGVLGEQGVENIAVSGISIHTSVNREIQQAALQSLRTHLPLLDVALGGYPAGRAEANMDLLGNEPDRTGGALPFLARITAVHTDGRNDRIRVVWEGRTGVIPYDGFKDTGQAWLLWKTGRRTGFDHEAAARFLKMFHVGDYVPVWPLASPSSGEEGQVQTLKLSVVPELEGSIVVLQNGSIRAMAGGFFNHFFNRAAEAKRQLGSIFKPLVYAAALQLKWDSLDPLRNVRDVFPFENTYYLPRPDHPPQSREVSMVFAGAKSENLATVWLLYRLTERLTMSEFRQLAERVGLTQRQDEDDTAYRTRIRDQYGVVVDREALMEAAFEEAKREAVSDIIFSGEEDMLSNLQLLHFSLDPRWMESETDDAGEILLFDFGRLQASKLAMEARLKQARSLLRQYDTVNAVRNREAIRACLANFYRIAGKGQGVRICYSENPERRHEGPTLPVTAEEFISGAVILEAEDIWIDGRFAAHVLDLLNETTGRQYEKLSALAPYKPECLFRIRDFRTLVGLTYVVDLSEHLGITTKLDPVLSFPLGPNAVSILEAALAYQAILTGKIHHLTPEDDVRFVPIITRILDREGAVIWEYRPDPQPALSDKVSASVAEILHQVMELGTGRTARDDVTILGVPIPTFGKTGTANRFTNSSFVGHVPGPNPETGKLDIREGYTIAAYVGYDDNRPMKTDHIAVYGATGALPLWTETANAVVNARGYMKQLQLADLAFDSPALTSFPILREFTEVPVSPLTGLPVNPSAEPPGDALPRIAADGAFEDGKWHGNRTFEPLKGASE